MSLYVISFGVFLLVVAGMSIGVMISGKRIQGSCGGLGASMDVNGKKSCGWCGRTYEEQVKDGCGKDDSPLAR